MLTRATKLGGRDAMQHPVLLHIKEHTWLWVTGLVALAVLAVVLNQSTPAALT